MMMRKLALLTSVDDQNFDSAVGWGKKWANKIWGSRYYNVFILRQTPNSQEISIKVLILC